jgi:hypothetical protein
MIFDDISKEITATQIVKDLINSNPYNLKEELYVDVSTSFFNSEGYGLSENEVISFTEQTLNAPFQDLSLYYFENDTSLLYCFDRNEASKLLLENPELSSYINDNNIIIMENNEFYAIYLKFILPEHEELFSSYYHTFLTKDTVCRLPKNPIIWKYPDLEVRCVINEDNLTVLYRNIPNEAINISNNGTIESWRNYKIIYFDTGFAQSTQTALENHGAQFENINN